MCSANVLKCGFIGLDSREKAIHHTKKCPDVLVSSNIKQVDCNTSKS